jgi:hypothetical protein
MFEIPFYNSLSDLGQTGAILLLLSFMFFSYRVLFFLFAKKTQGVIVDFVASRGQKGGTVYKPVFKFTTDDGEEITAYSKLGSNPPMFSVGQNINVHYSRLNPKSAQITKFKSMFFTPMLLGFAGTVIMFFEIYNRIKMSGG